MISLACVYLERPVYLLEKHYARQLVRQCDTAEAQSQRCPGFHIFAEAQAAA